MAMQFIQSPQGQVILPHADRFPPFPPHLPHQTPIMGNKPLTTTIRTQSNQLLKHRHPPLPPIRRNLLLNRQPTQTPRLPRWLILIDPIPNARPRQIMHGPEPRTEDPAPERELIAIGLEVATVGAEIVAVGRPVPAAGALVDGGAAA
jgi:hypothetical protein